MNALSKVLLFKIAFTVTSSCLPLLLFPVSLLQRLGFAVPVPQIFLRMLGVAYTALVVGYAFGLRDSLRGIYPGNVVWVGIVSNGGAFLLLAAAAVMQVWASWGGFAQGLMWWSLLSLCGITAGLILCGPLAQRLGKTPGRAYASLQ